tara:strand:- start:4571 stop:4720 length:150 start_codon:yes stop_codon:yes gene_type:complete
MLTESQKAQELAKMRSKKMRFPSVAMNQNPKKKKKKKQEDADAAPDYQG